MRRRFGLALLCCCFLLSGTGPPARASLSTGAPPSPAMCRGRSSTATSIWKCPSGRRANRSVAAQGPAASAGPRTENPDRQPPGRHPSPCAVRSLQRRRAVGSRPRPDELATGHRQNLSCDPSVRAAIRSPTPTGRRPPQNELEIVTANMETFGLPNPIALFFHGQANRDRSTMQLPTKLARELLGFSDTVGNVSDFRLNWSASRPLKSGSPRPCSRSR